MRATLLLLIAMGLIVGGNPLLRSAVAEDFRIDTDFFIGSEKKPNAEVLTLFQGGNVYDFQLQEPEVTLFEPRRGALTLLDVKRKVRATLTTAELLDAAVSLQAAAVESKKPVFVAAAQPDFKTAVEELTENGNPLTRLKFTGNTVQYTVVAQTAKHPEAAREFKYFTDWSARLNSIRTGLPAGARLEVNEALAAKGLIPVRIERVIQNGILGQRNEVRTQHLVNWRLSQEDHRRIDEFSTQLTNSTLVTFEEYVRPKGKAAPQQQVRK